MGSGRSEWFIRANAAIEALVAFPSPAAFPQERRQGEFRFNAAIVLLAATELMPRSITDDRKVIESGAPSSFIS